MEGRRIAELFRMERSLARMIRRKREQYEELVEAAISTGAFRYDQEKVTGSSPDGSRQERLVMRYMEIEMEIRELEQERGQIRQQIGVLAGQLPPRERRAICARHLEHKEVAEIMEQFGISYETYRTYHKRAMRRMESMLDIVPKT